MSTLDASTTLNRCGKSEVVRRYGHQCNSIQVFLLLLKFLYTVYLNSGYVHMKDYSTEDKSIVTAAQVKRNANFGLKST